MRETLIRLEQLCRKLNVAPSTLWRWRKRGLFPEPVRIPGTSIQGWREKTVDELIEKHFSNAQEEQK